MLSYTTIRGLALSALVSLLLGAGASEGAQSGWQVSGAGGSKGTTTGYSLSGTVGQTAVGGGAGEDLQVAQGYWQTFEPFVCGDFDGNGFVNISDAVALITFMFSSGPAPKLQLVADANCDGSINISDAVYVIAFVFGEGPAPCAECD